MSIVDLALTYWAYPLGAIVLLLLFFNAFRYIPNSKVGIQEKLWSFKGSVESGIIALDGEAGYQPDVLRGGSGGNGAGGPATGNVMEALLAMLLSDKIGAELSTAATNAPRSATAEAVRQQIRDGMERPRS